MTRSLCFSIMRAYLEMRTNLFGAHINDMVVIDHIPQGWVVFYSERGSESRLRLHATEDAACRDLLARLRG